MTLRLVKASEPLLAGGDETRAEEYSLDQAPASAEWETLAGALGIDQDQCVRIAARAERMGVSFHTELIASGVVRETEIVRALAYHLGVRFLPSIRAEGLLVTERQSFEALGRQGGLPVIGALDRQGHRVLLVAPVQVGPAEIAAYLHRRPEMASQVAFVTAPVLRDALKERGKHEIMRRALCGLFEAFPQLSARTVFNGAQGMILGAVVAGAIFCLLVWPWETLFVTHVLLSLCFLLCVGFKLLTVLGMVHETVPPHLETASIGEMPVYTVLVALYKEAAIVPELLVSLSRIVWPRCKLEVKLVCESDDHETLEAIRAVQLKHYVEVIEVPPSLPRTKPKALAYALPQSTGEYVVIFDAEDRPHPYQLIEAWRRFKAGSDRLACLQAPLAITNGHGGWLAKMFAFEYSALFRGILPWLSRKSLILPLGGTSNHFRRDILEEVGGWDPYNVTEDADLGIRLYSAGYDIQMITCPTYEDAPTTFRVWLPQRTRWFKGWIQTWLVHMRHPIALWRAHGPASFIVLQILFPCTLIAVMSNLVLAAALILFSCWVAATGIVPAFYGAWLLVDIANIVLGYGGFLAMGWLALPPNQQRSAWKYACLTPVYWIILSLAAWRAVWQVYRHPHHWEKTPHEPQASEDQRRNSGPDPMIFGSSVPTESMSRP